MYNERTDQVIVEREKNMQQKYCESNSDNRVQGTW